MPPPEFKMSESTEHRLKAALDGLTQEHKAQILGAVADLLAEAEVHMRKKVLEDLRQEWAETLATMLRSSPRK